MSPLTAPSSSISFRELSPEPGISHLLAPGEVIRLKTHLIPDPPYYFGNRITGQLGALVKEQNPDRVYLVTNQMLLDLYGAELLKSFPEQNLNVTVITIEDNEETKTFQTLESLCETLVEKNVSKASLVIGFGGGCLTNIVGLASAMIFRGIRYVEIPTTLMGVTDSSLSNKQAVNGKHGKNQFGVYYGPVFLFGDTQFLMSEPVGGKKSAIVEGIKNGWISDPSLVDYFEAKLQKDLKDYTEQDITELSLKIILSKLEILKADPTEKKLGMILEYGHTFGHSMEFLTKGAITHGMAVAKGMCIAAELGHRLGYISREIVDRHYRIFGDILGLDLNIPATVSVDEMLHVMVSDNKKTLGGTKFVLLERVGKCLNPDGDYQVKVPAEIVKAILDEYKQR